MLSIFLFSCENKKENVIDFNDVMEESERYREEDVAPKILEEKIDSTIVIRDLFLQNGIETKSLSYITERMFPERFGVRNFKKYELILSNDTLRYFNWNYKDSIQTMNAFFNWMDHFGNKRISVRIGEQRRMQKKPFIIYVGDTNLIFIEAISKINEQEWRGYFEKLGYNDWHYLIKQNKNSKAKWYRFEDGEKIEVEN